MIRVGNAQAFWGDKPSAAHDLLAQAPNLDYLTMDYLAEVSMSILAVQRQRDPQLGYARDFVSVVRGLVPYWNAGGRCKLIANAGGLNPIGCAQACIQALEQSGCRSLKIGIVHGDDVLACLTADSPSSEKLFQNLDSGTPISNVRSRLITANAYVGSQGIVSALKAGADIVITGRIADPSMVVAPCIYHFGWEPNRWDCIAGATVAGHLLECGTHATGGISTDWLQVPDVAHLGFPIAEIESDGVCTITKSPTSGGCVTEQTIKEQLLYEIGDPSRYLSPDATVSFLRLKVEQQGKDRVRVAGAIGGPPPETLKVSATYQDGFRAAGTLTIFGPDSVRKAERTGQIVLDRLAEAGHQYRDTIIECLGNAASVPVEPSLGMEWLHETVLRIAVESEDKRAVEHFSQEMMPMVTAGPQGTTGYAEGRPRVHEVFRYWPCLIPTSQIQLKLDLVSSKPSTPATAASSAWPPQKPHQESNADRGAKTTTQSQAKSEARLRLIDFAYGRSGDKGTGANIGVLIRSMDHYDWLCQWLTAERVQNYFQPIGVSSVERYEVVNLGGLNFVVRGILRRGLRNDAQGKALAQALLSMPLEESPS